MKTNENLQKDVQNALKWEPLLSAAQIGVTVKDGVVTLSGTVDSYAKKTEAEDAAKNVSGVKVVVEKIEIKYGSNGTKSDGDIASEVLRAYKWNWEIPEEKIKVRVEKGWVTLEGEVTWNYQREAAKTAIRSLSGVLGITNSIKIKSEVADAIEQKEIENALDRNWSIDGKAVKVKVSGTKVTLNGIVDSLYEKDEAERIVWNAPGVWSVDNELVVEYD
jgi:osmotically-inducible protein OsmY